MGSDFLCIISSLQLVGVILVSAMLVIPAATASLLSKRMNAYLLLACAPVQEQDLAELSVVSWKQPSHRSSDCFGFSIIFSVGFIVPPQKRFIPLWLKSRSENSRIAIENTLKAAYQIIEKKDFRKVKFPFLK